MGTSGVSELVAAFRTAVAASDFGDGCRFDARRGRISTVARPSRLVLLHGWNRVPQADSELWTCELHIASSDSAVLKPSMSIRSVYETADWVEPISNRPDSRLDDALVVVTPLGIKLKVKTGAFIVASVSEAVELVAQEIRLAVSSRW